MVMATTAGIQKNDSARNLWMSGKKIYRKVFYSVKARKLEKKNRLNLQSTFFEKGQATERKRIGSILLSTSGTITDEKSGPPFQSR